jgi:hypothetical protein
MAGFSRVPAGDSVATVEEPPPRNVGDMKSRYPLSPQAGAVAIIATRTRKWRADFDMLLPPTKVKIALRRGEINARRQNDA